MFDRRSAQGKKLVGDRRFGKIAGISGATCFDGD
jgi:hypothetical protein